MAAMDDEDEVGTYPTVPNRKSNSMDNDIFEKKLLTSMQSPLQDIRSWIEIKGIEEGTKGIVTKILTEIEQIISTEPFMPENDFVQLLDRCFVLLEHVICAKYLLSRSDIKETETSITCKTIIEQVTSQETQRVCSRAFKAGDIVWNCKQCQKDSTCVLCQDCFTKSDHTSHDVYFYHVMTDAGGCCDCGDEGAWDPVGFCTRHGLKDNDTDADPRLILDDDFRLVVTEAVNQIVGFISKLSSIPRTELVIEANPCHPASIRDRKGLIDYFKFSSWISRNREARDAANTPLFLKDWCNNLDNENTPNKFVLWQVRSEDVYSSTIITNEVNRNFEAFSAEIKHRPSILVSCTIKQFASWLLEYLCFSSDAITRIVCCAFTASGTSFDPLCEMIVKDFYMSDSSSKALRNLYIRLLVDSLFKHRFAIAFAKQYQNCTHARVNALPILEISDKDTIFSLSVQFLNRPSHVELLVNEHHFLRSIFQSLIICLKACVNVDGSLDLTHPVLTHRKAKCIVTDLTYVLSTPGMSKYFLTYNNQEYLSMWFDLLKLMYCMHLLRRVVYPHNPVRDERWVAAFNLGLSFLSLYFDLCSGLMVEESSEMDEKINSCNILSQIVTFSAEKMREILSEKQVKLRVLGSRWGPFTYVQHNVASDPTTFHVPAQRFFAHLYCCCISSTLDSDSNNYIKGLVTKESFWVALMSQSVNALVLFSQSHARMWTRNENVACQAMNYQSLPFVSGLFYDIRVLQCSAMNIPSHCFLGFLINSFGLSSVFKIGNGEETEESIAAFSDEELVLLIESMIDVLVWTITELPGISPIAFNDSLEADRNCNKLLRREIIHYVAVRKRTLSMINDHCAHMKNVLALNCSAVKVRQILDTCATEINRSDGMGPIQFDLKPECWKEFDPYFHRLMKIDRDVSRERFVSMRGKAQESETQNVSFFPGDISSRNGWKRPLPATAWFGDIHPSFCDVRKSLLVSPVCGVIIHEILEKFVSESGESVFVSGSFLASGLHLLTLQIYQLHNIHAETTKSSEQNDTQLKQDSSQWGVTSVTCEMVISQLLREGEKSTMEILLQIWHENTSCDEFNRESVRWILWQLSTMNKECYDLCSSHQKQRKTVTQSEKEKRNRKRKAQRQALLNMKLSQEKASKAFLALAEEIGESEEDGNSQDNDTDSKKKTKLGGSSRTLSIDIDDVDTNAMLLHYQNWTGPECVSCHECFTLQQGITSYLGFRQSNDVLYHMDSTDENSNSWTTVFEDDGGKDEIIQLCGHAIHNRCLAQYRRTINPQQTGGQVPPTNFLCPLCKTLCNFQLPCVPSVIIEDSLSRTNNGPLSLSHCVKWFATELSNDDIEFSVSQKARLTAASDMLHPLDEDLSKLSGGSSLAQRHHSPRVIWASHDARRREQSTTVALNDSQLESQLRIFQNPSHSIICHSIGYTIIAETVAAENNTFPSQVLVKLQHLMDAAKAYLWVNNGQELRELSEFLSNMMSQTSKTSRTSILRQSPELLAVFTALLAVSEQYLITAMRSLWVVKLVQAILDYNPAFESEWSKEHPDLEIFPEVINWGEQISFLISKHAWNTRVALENMAHLNAHVSEYMCQYAHVCQIIMALFRRTHTDIGLLATQEIIESHEDFLPRLHNLSQKPVITHMIDEWLDVLASCKEWKPRCVSGTLSTSIGRPLSFRPLYRLRDSYTEQYVEAHNGNCEVCQEHAHDRAICLICGAVMSAGPIHPPHGYHASDKGMCTRHMEDQHNGIGIVLLFRRSSSVLLIHNDQSAYWGSLYVDKNGDDQHSAPSLPMFLDPLRWAKLTRLWQTNSIPTSVSSLRNMSNGVIRRNYF